MENLRLAARNSHRAGSAFNVLPASPTVALPRGPADHRHVVREGAPKMQISIRPLHPVFAGEVSGVDCARPLAADAVAAIEAGMDRYAVLVFRDQDLTDEQQLAFTRHFGELENYPPPGHIRRAVEQRLGPGIADFSNLDKDGNILSAT